jgi:hypothetical protein
MYVNGCDNFAVFGHLSAYLHPFMRARCIKMVGMCGNSHFLKEFWQVSGLEFELAFTLWGRDKMSLLHIWCCLVWGYVSSIEDWRLTKINAILSFTSRCADSAAP